MSKRRSRGVGCAIALVILAVIAGITFALYWRDRAASRGRLTRERIELMLKSDLNHLATAEAQHYSEQTSFSGDLRSLQFRPSPGVEVWFERVDSAGWSAVVTHTETDAACSGGASVMFLQVTEAVCR